MTRADLVDRIRRILSASGATIAEGYCPECDEDVDVSVSADAKFAEKFIDELDRDGLEIIKK
jgi:hypothetical protein